MGKIEILPEEVVAKISAGEVIDAPYSVVRELIDNSIDAKSTKIIVNIVEGGKKLIEVIDDGEGIEKDDLEKCYLRHSTSKIKTIEDIYRILTMGFRGEALASIAEVSELEIISKPKHQEEGYKLLVKGGKLVSITPHPSQDGTTVKIKNLFFNLPARRNFLKSETTEFRSILDVFTKKAIPFPEIHFELSHNLKRELILPRTNSLLERIKTIYPEIKDLNYIKKTYDEMEIELFFSKPSVNRPTRNFQQLFVNKRFVESKTFFTSISNAYSNLLPKGSFPIVFCFISIDPSLIDVNIHPAKKEIKFRNEGKLFHYIIQTVKEGLSQFDQILNIEETDFKFTEFEKEIKESIESFLTKTKEKQYSQPKASYPLQPTIQTQPSKNQTTKSPYQSVTQNQQIYGFSYSITQEPKLDQTLRFVGVIFQTYIIFEDTQNQRLLVIDQHALHEKLLYSKLYSEVVEKKSLIKQKLISPIKLNFSKDHILILQENFEILDKLGFEFSVEDDGITILSLPSFFGKEIDPRESLIEICDKIKEGLTPTFENIIEIIATISCRSAIKGGYNITSYEAYKLIDEAKKINDSFVCPHGRPSMIYIDKKTLESIFLRKL